MRFRVIVLVICSQYLLSRNYFTLMVMKTVIGEGYIGLDARGNVIICLKQEILANRLSLLYLFFLFKVFELPLHL